MDILFTPWRYPYLTAPKREREDGCIFCKAARSKGMRDTLTLYRNEQALVMLNRYPYTNGHLMVAPYEHVGRLQELDDPTLAEMMSLARRAMTRLEDVYSPHGYNVGFNQGRVAGAGVEHHIHLHVVPRWGGDTNFMPVIADTRVMPQTLEQSYEALRGSFD